MNWKDKHYGNLLLDPTGYCSAPPPPLYTLALHSTPSSFIPGDFTKRIITASPNALPWKPSNRPASGPLAAPPYSEDLVTMESHLTEGYYYHGD